MGNWSPRVSLALKSIHISAIEGAQLWLPKVQLRMQAQGEGPKDCMLRCPLKGGCRGFICTHRTLQGTGWFPQEQSLSMGVPIDKDYSVLGSIMGSLCMETTTRVSKGNPATAI